MKKKFASILLVFVLVFTTVFAGTTSSFALGETSNEYAGKIVILHTNDVHGAIDGYQYLAGLKEQYQEKGAAVILADAGDYSQGSIYVSSSKGADAITLMNETGYDVATLGNHEFDYGYEQLTQNLEGAKFEVLCANVFKDGKTIRPESTIIKKDNVKIGFFGLETPEAQTKANPSLLKGLEFLTGNDLSELVKKEAAALKNDGADIVIGLTHLGVDAESEPYRSLDLFDGVTDVDFVIDGHSHTVMTKGPNGEAIQSTGTGFENVGVVVIDKTTKKIEKNELVALKGADGKYLEGLKGNDSVNNVAKDISEKIDKEYDEVFATSEVTLNGDKAPNGNRDSETNNGDLITDAILWSVKSTGGIDEVDENNIVAITNGGGIRAAINPGNVTKKDINTVLPFGNTVAVVYITGAELLEALEASTYCTPEAVGAFPQIAGMEVEINTDVKYVANAETYPNSTYYGPKTINRVTIKSVNGKEFDPKAKYAVVSNDFCAAGGDTYYAFASAKSKFDTGIPMDEAVMEFIKSELNGVIGVDYAKPQGRLTIISTNVDDIVKRSKTALESSDVKLEYSSTTYSGNTKTPSVSVKCNGNTLKKDEDYTVSYTSGRKNVGTYTVTVKGKGNYEGTVKKTFKINPKGSTIKTPKKAKKAFIAKWTKQSAKMSKSRITGYQVRYSLKKNFSSGVKTKSVKGYKKTSVKISKLKSKKTYYVQVRTYKKVDGKNYYSSWSKKKAVKTK